MLIYVLAGHPSLSVPLQVLQGLSEANQPQIDPTNISILAKQACENIRLASESVSDICKIIQSSLESTLAATDEQRQQELAQSTELLRWSFEIWMNELNQARVYHDILNQSKRMDEIDENDLANVGDFHRLTEILADELRFKVTALLTCCIESIVSPASNNNISLAESFLRTIPLCSPRKIVDEIAGASMRSSASAIFHISRSLRWSLDGSHIHTKPEMELAQRKMQRVYELLLVTFELWMPTTDSTKEKVGAVQLLKEIEGLLRGSLEGYRVEDRIGSVMEEKILRLLELIWTRIEGLGRL